ncbi:radical SAM protein [Nonomuraea sp. NPDC049784]|uniref:radical SAM protein n=1 Tax=Nonomuraea sp. NPDC049784 TaxID=3154361 RepID=UPI0033CB0A16
MHLMEMLRFRPVPGSAVYLGLTRRCPLTCRHCSTNSLISSEEHDAGLFLGFADTFTAEDHPEIVLMSGGEALLRPRLVRDIARRASSVGTRSYVASGMFFARTGKIPRLIQEAIDEVDHFAASLDVFHEEEVPRSAVLKILRRLVDAGKDVSLQLVGMSDDDPYLAEATAEARDVLEDRVPMLVGLVGASGRAAEWMPDRRTLTHLPLSATADPCGVAAWPIVTFDGTVIACCNQAVVDQGRNAPAHLKLGHSATDTWQTIRSRSRASATLRAVRTIGPRMIAQDAGLSPPAEQCAACYALSAEDPQRKAVDLVERPGFAAMELGVQQILSSGGPVGYARRYGSARYADMVTLGYRPQEQPCAV